MGKSKKFKPSQMASKSSLEQDIENTKFASSKNRNKLRNRQDEDEEFVESKISKKILKTARAQQRELQPEVKTDRSVNFTAPDSESESEDDSVQAYDYASFFDNLHINQEEEDIMKTFMAADPKPRNTLADIIREKVTEKNTEVASEFNDTESVCMKDIDPKIVAIYEGCGEVLKKYRSGKLPKPFKALHKFKNWEQYLNITDPPSWSAAAMYQATRIFASNFDESNAHRFYNLVLLPRIRDDIAECHKLNFHLYQALIKALYKPTAFMTGLIFPLLESGDCTLREAIILGSVIQKYSVPVLHSATATLKIAKMSYTGANSIFLRILLDKKYSLPFSVVDAVHEHFMRFLHDDREMPVLWHQALLTFVQRYKSDISSSQRDGLYQLLRKQYHHKISGKIEEELRHSKCRSEN